MMAEEEQGAPAEEQQSPAGSSSGPAGCQRAADRAEGTEGRREEEDGGGAPPSVDSCLEQFKSRKFFVLRVTSNLHKIDPCAESGNITCNVLLFQKFSCSTKVLGQVCFCN